MSPVPNKPPKQEPVPRVDSKSTRGEEKIQDLQDPLDDNLSRLAKKH